MVSISGEAEPGKLSHKLKANPSCVLAMRDAALPAQTGTIRQSPLPSEHKGSEKSRLSKSLQYRETESLESREVEGGSLTERCIGQARLSTLTAPVSKWALS